MLELTIPIRNPTEVATGGSTTRPPGLRRRPFRCRATGVCAWVTVVMVGMGCSFGGGNTRPFTQSLGDLSTADRIEVTENGSIKVATIADQQQVVAVATFVGRYRDGWTNVWTGAGAPRYVTFYHGNKALKWFGLGPGGINTGAYVRFLSEAEVLELVRLLGIEWPPTEIRLPPLRFTHSLGDLSTANRIEITRRGITKVTTITDQQRVAAVAAFVGRFHDGWINVFTGAGGALHITFSHDDKGLKTVGVGPGGINDGDDLRPMPEAEVRELVRLLGIEWPPPEFRRVLPQ